MTEQKKKMKRGLKIFLISLATLVVLVLITGFIGKTYFSSTFVTFEEDYKEATEFETLIVDGLNFLDRNGNGKLDVYEDRRRSIDERVDDLLSQMTWEEKIHLLKGSGLASAMGQTEPGEGIPGAVGTIVPTPRLGVPTVYLSDGPAGLRIQPTREGEDRTYYCTAFPIASLLSSTWNENLVEQVGEAMGTEAMEYGIDVILGPGANIHRHPLCGRNFEYYSEDPLLTGVMGASMVNGIQSKGVGTSLKHYVANNQETERFWNDVIVSDRALREIYLKAFEIVVRRSQPWTVMSSYNLVNGTPASENEFLLTEVLRDDWGFEGLVVTDWFGGQDAVAQVSAGNDLLEPGTKKQWKALIEGYENGELTEEVIDRAAGRILKLSFKSGKFESREYSNNPDLKAHAEITRQSATEGMVLLKNEEALPLKNGINVALLGVTSFDFIAGGTGSGDVNEAYSISLYEGLDNAGFEINKTSEKLYEEHKATDPEAFIKPEGIGAMFTPFNPPQIDYSPEQLEEIVTSSDVGILTIGRNAGEGKDRVENDDFLLTELELELIDKTAAAFHGAGKKLVVVLNVSGVIETASWNEKPDAILLAWQGGQEGGNSVADILRGNANPSGKLPMTFPVNLNDHASNANFPLVDTDISMTEMVSNLLMGKEVKPDEEKVRNKDYTLYEEGIYVGYRHFDKADLEVAYPFGFGLSYTDFEYSDLEIERSPEYLEVKLTVKNSGSLAGKEVVQIYTEKPDSSIDRAERELKGFAKTDVLEPGASQEVLIQIPISELSYWDEQASSWAMEHGTYYVAAAASSRDIRLQAELEL